MDLVQQLAAEFSIRPQQVENTVALLDEGNTIPFLARYRKERTGISDDRILRALSERLLTLRNLEEQRNKIRETLSLQKVLTAELEQALAQASNMTELEDLYRPYRPKKNTRASLAKQNGLQPLADLLYAQKKGGQDPWKAAEAYVTETVPTAQAALQGAQDIMAERIAEDATIRRRLRTILLGQGVLCSRAVKADADSVYSLYFDFQGAVGRLAGHRILAINRGEREKKLRVRVVCDRARALQVVFSNHVRPDAGPAASFVKKAAEDAYDRLIFPSLERELRTALTEKACREAIGVFADNLHHLLMQPPVKGLTVVGLDPGYRHGCKAAIVDESGRVLDTGVMYPTKPFCRIEEAKKFLKNWVLQYGASVFAIGNGTASGETEQFVSDCIREWSAENGMPVLSYVIVNEAGASVYSASLLASQEFPDMDVSLRSAVSIARRLQDPLAELVKIDPQSIGVGQYQHDMPQTQLTLALDGVVEDCVNHVGVDLNTASVPLLTRVAGISGKVARNIVAYREEKGLFTCREELKNVSQLGEKTFLQCAGFLRVPESRNVLDHTAVHPESYPAAEKLLSLCGVSAQDASFRENGQLSLVAEKLGEEWLAGQLQIGLPTLRDILRELQQPGRDPRDRLPGHTLRTNVLTLEELKPGVKLIGTIRNVTDFGAFVDIGVHQDGLVHISQMADRFIRHPSEMVKVGDTVTVWVLSVDLEKKRIGLSMKKTIEGEPLKQ